MTTAQAKRHTRSDRSNQRVRCIPASYLRDVAQVKGGHYVMVFKIQWKPFWLATQLYPYNDWTGRQNVVSYDVIAEAPFEDRGIKV